MTIKKSKKILVTGGCGFIGSNIANTLSETINSNSTNDSLFDITVLDDLSLGTTSNIYLSSKSPTQKNNIKFVKGSVMDYDLIFELSKECDYVFHEAAKSSSPMFADNPIEGMNVNVIGFMNIMEAAARNNVSKVIYASSSSIYNGQALPFKEINKPDPKTFYETSFFCRESIAKSYYIEKGLNSIGLRYFSVYGYFNELHKDKFANTVSQFIWSIQKKQSPILYGSGNQTRDFTFIDDIVTANILAMTSECEFGIYNVGTGVETSFNTLVDLINKYGNTDIKPLYIDNSIKNYVQSTKADISFIKSQLGYHPKWTIDQGIKHILLKVKEKGIVSMQQL